MISKVFDSGGEKCLHAVIINQLQNPPQIKLTLTTWSHFTLPKTKMSIIFFVLFFLGTAQSAQREKAKTRMHKMNMASFHGCVSSMDAIHIAMDRCSNRFCQLHIEFKMSHPSRAYNLSVNHRRRIHFSTTGHPASSTVN